MSALSVVGSQLLARHKRPEIGAILSTANTNGGNPPDLSFPGGPTTPSVVPRKSLSDVDALIINLYGEVIDTGRHEALLSTCRLLLGMPASCHPMSYPGESPTPDNTCPVCGSPCVYICLSTTCNYTNLLNACFIGPAKCRGGLRSIFTSAL